MEMSRDNDQKNAYINNKVQLQNHSLFFIHKMKSIPSTASFRYGSPMAYNTTSSLDKLTCTDYVDFSNGQDRFEQFSWSRNGSEYLDTKHKVFTKDDIKEIQLVKNLAIGEAVFNQLRSLHKITLHCVARRAKLIGNWIMQQLKL